MRIYQVDVFTDRVFSGNPAGVCVLNEPASEIWMQNVAAEMNLSETAYLVREADAFRLRWFTPKKEVDLCGHATLASAHVLWESGALSPGDEARFISKSGPLSASRNGEHIVLDFPSEEDSESAAPVELTAGLGVELKYVGRNRMDYVVEVASEAMVRSLKPDLQRLKRLDVRGVIVTSIADSGGVDFVSRFFAPAYGIDEDPVTGSAHCCLGPYWKRRLHKDEFSAYQASARGGYLSVKVGQGRIYIGGKAITVFAADMRAGS